MRSPKSGETSEADLSATPASLWQPFLTGASPGAITTMTVDWIYYLPRCLRLPGTAARCGGTQDTDLSTSMPAYWAAIIALPPGVTMTGMVFSTSFLSAILLPDRSHKFGATAGACFLTSMRPYLETGLELSPGLITTMTAAWISL